MINSLRFTAEEASKIVFLSDLHLNQGKQFLLDGRNKFQGGTPFNTFPEHDNWIVKEWCTHLHDKIVFNLGDAVFRDGTGHIFDKLSRLPVRAHYFIWGNHNSGAKQVYAKALQEHGYSDDVEVYPLKHNNITFVGKSLQIFVGPRRKQQEIHLSHFPSRIWDNMSDKSDRMKNAPLPSIALSGHSHGNDPDRNILARAGKSLDVGVENAIIYDDKFWFTYDEIIRILAKKPVQIFDHHNGQESSS